VNLLDLLVVLLAISAAVGGYRLGFLTRAVSWLGLIAGVLLGAALLPGLLRRLQEASDASKVLVAVATLLGLSLVGQGIGLALGSKLRIALPQGPLRRADRIAGGVVGALGVLVGLWLLLPTLAEVRGWTAEQARGSLVAEQVARHFPDVPDAIDELRRVMGEEAFPRVFNDLRAAPDLGTPPASSGLTTALAEAVAQSTVKVEGIACDMVQEGSGFVIQDDLVMTNAHVVAGEDETQVEFRDGTQLDATVVAFDPARDLAVLRVDDLDESAHPVLGLRDAEVGDVGGVFGYPGGGPLEISEFEVAQEIVASGNDIYDQNETQRDVLTLSAALAPGDSGSALVVNENGEARVVGVAFAVAQDRSDVAYALALSEVEDVMASDLITADDTGGCLR
jgi:S1-C subfamily serine protease